MVEIFHQMSNIDNGILQRFMIVVGDCHKYLRAEQDRAEGEIKGGRLSLKKIYDSLLKYDKDTDSNFYLSHAATRFVLHWLLLQCFSLKIMLNWQFQLHGH